MITEHLSHYREGVYRELDADEQWEFVFGGGAEVRDGSIPSIPAGVLKRRVALANHWIGRKMLWQSGVLRLCLTMKWDAVVFVGNASFVSTWVAAALVRALGGKVYFWTIGWHRPDSRLKGVFRRCFYGLANRLLLYGQDGYDIAIASGMSPSSLVVIGNSYSDTGVSSSISSDDDVDVSSVLPPVGMRLVGAVARLGLEKRFDLLLEAVSELRQAGRDVGVVLVGAGPAADELRVSALDLDVPLFLTGPIHDGAVLDEIYERLDVTVLPERAGLTVIQSLGHATPVVTVDDASRQVPEFRAVHPGSTGQLYLPGSIASLSDAIDRCLTMVLLDAEATAEACRNEVALNWSAAAHAERILDALSARE